MSKKTVANILSDLELRNEVPKNWRETIATEATRLSLAGPWHTRLLIGFGAWLSSFLFIGFLSALGMTVGGFGIYGVVLLGASLAVSKFKRGTFWDQAVLAFSLSGQAFVITSITNDIHSNDVFKIMSIFVVVFNLIWPFLLRTRTQAFISMLFFAGGVVEIFYAFDIRFLVPVAPAALFFAAAYTVTAEPKYFGNPLAEILPAMASGLLFGGFGAVSISSYYIFEAFAAKGNEIYPHPWLTSILVILSIYYFCVRSDDVLFRTRGAFAYAALFLIGVASFKAPGILFALGVAVVGAIYLESSWLWLGLLFGAVFTTLFLYGTDLSLLTKSYFLLGLGALLFGIRKMLPVKKAASL